MIVPSATIANLGDAAFHVALVVADVVESSARFTARYGWTWTPVRSRQQSYRTYPSGALGETQVDVCFSKHAPFRIELISAAPGTPWEVADGQAFHHLAWWVDDLAAAMAELTSRGAVVEAHGVDPVTGSEPARFVYCNEGGMRVELQDAARRADFEAWFAE